MILECKEKHSCDPPDALETHEEDLADQRRRLALSRAAGRLAVRDLDPTLVPYLQQVIDLRGLFRGELTRYLEAREARDAQLFQEDAFKSNFITTLYDFRSVQRRMLKRMGLHMNARFIQPQEVISQQTHPDTLFCYACNLIGLDLRVRVHYRPMSNPSARELQDAMEKWLEQRKPIIESLMVLQQRETIIRDLRGQVDHLFVRLDRALARVYRGKHGSRLDIIRMSLARLSNPEPSGGTCPPSSHPHRSGPRRPSHAIGV